MKTKHKNPEIVYSNGKPTAVILDINEYREILERLEDADDIKYLEQQRKKGTKTRKFSDFLREIK